VRFLALLSSASPSSPQPVSGQSARPAIFSAHGGVRRGAPEVSAEFVPDVKTRSAEFCAPTVNSVETTIAATASPYFVFNGSLPFKARGQSRISVIQVGKCNNGHSIAKLARTLQCVARNLLLLARNLHRFFRNR
jgi:hypothetical protein